MTAPAIPVLETGRLRLEPPAAAHFPAWRAFYTSAEGTARRGGTPKSERDAWMLLAADIGHWALRGFGIWAVTEAAGGRVLGACGLWHPAGWPRHELTWWLLPEARGQGFATEASRAAIGFGYDRLGLDPVETHMQDDNLPARRLAARLGGRVIARETFPDGRARDVFALPHPARAEDAA
ncbi:GNAT family N-acetyltransferase [Paralimibaculum aggregatum]|uniref:GNAT family N-acetyltransferase n=1 Tax=Paralimibaculum aggregatum TaxID=3036245 RepID=A0ABQ6LTW0_9RHOB|nr:GNAT family N-acetyltransferase [Limibaculum sp. NKW23]GMG85476.1 GNAT family N-acetyltransferase [Limibaculum sp. NKW23]